MGFKTTCDCGGVSVTIPGKPDRINACPCSYCRQIGAHWAYFPPEDVSVTGALDSYLRGDREIVFERCAGCGTLIRWRSAGDHAPRTGIHMAIFGKDVTAGVPVVSDPPRAGV